MFYILDSDFLDIITNKFSTNEILYRLFNMSNIDHQDKVHNTNQVTSLNYK